MTKTTRRVLISVVIGAVFLGLALRGVHWGDLTAALGRTNWLLLIPCVLAMLVGHLIRVHRWWLLVDAAHPITLRKIAPHALVGYLAISTLPLRTGEFVRPFLLKTREGIPFSMGLATCVVERIFDLLGLAAMLAIMLLAGLPSDTIMIRDTEVDIVLLSRLAFGVTLSGMAFLIALMVVQRPLVKVIETVLGRFSQGLATKVGEMLASFIEGLRFIKGLKRTVLVSLDTVAIWLLTGLAMWGTAAALGLTQIDLAASFGVVAITMVGIAIPAGPAFVGNYELFCQASMLLYGVSETDGFATAVIHHMLGFVVTVGLGIAALGGVTGLMKLARQAEQKAEQQTA